MFHKHKYPVTYTYHILVVILLLALSGCSARAPVEPTPSPETATPVPPTNTTEPTATTEPTPTPPTPTIEPSPTSPPPMPECPDGVVMFRSNVQTTYIPLDHYFSICPDGTGLVPVVSNELLWEDGISPEGDRMALQHNRKLLIEDLTTHETTTILEKLQYEITESFWSPDGEYVAYIVLDKEPGGEWFYRVEIVHLSTHTLSTNFYPGYLPGILADGFTFVFDRLFWSPNGTYLLVAGGGFEVLTVNCSADNVCTAESRGWSVKQSSGGGYNGFEPSPWSPDENFIAYACMTAYETESDVPSLPNVEFEYSLCIQDVNGNLTQEFKAEALGVENIRTLTWSPDGTRIAFTAKEIGQSDDDIFVLNLDDETVINLTGKMDGYQEDPIWIP